MEGKTAFIRRKAAVLRRLTYDLQRETLVGGGLDGDELSHPAAVAKHHGSGNAGVEGIVGATADIFAGLERCAALADQNRTAGNDLAREALNAEPLGVGITPVFSGA